MVARKKGQRTRQVVAPPELPTDPVAFWLGSTDDNRRLPPPPQGQRLSALKRLGPLPFPRRGFPMMGFLATLYDHVSAYATEALRDVQESGDVHDGSP